MGLLNIHILLVNPTFFKKLSLSKILKLFEQKISDRNERKSLVIFKSIIYSVI